MNDDRKVPLDLLDPAFDDPGFWSRFQTRVMESAGPELARRRWSHDLTVSDVVLSWGRLLVPVSLAAAILASVFLLNPGETPFVPHVEGIEELLLAELDNDPGLLILKADGPPDALTFLVAVEQR